MNNPITLSVRLMTYNHAEYITQCLIGVEKQQTSFPFEVIIGDDYSTDNNLELIKNFIKKSQNKKITYILLNRQKRDNYYFVRKVKGRLYNFINIIENCKGKYIALCEGDDYWTDPYKLQKQVNFLEENPEYVMCFHPVQKVNERGNSIEKTNSETAENTRIEELIKGNYIYSVSVAFLRSALPREFPLWFYKIPMGDWALFILLATKGKIKMLPDIMSVYRVHLGGVWSKQTELSRLKNGLKARILFYENLDKKYSNIAQREMLNAICNLSDTYKKSGNLLAYYRYQILYYLYRLHIK